MKPKAPMFQDPIYNGAADPAIIWNKKEKNWWIFYTSRRAYSPNIEASYMHGSDIGICSSSDGGLNWIYRGTAMGLNFEYGKNTFWAPEIIEYDGIYHMYVSYVKGVPINWDCARSIIHYTSRDLWQWNFESILKLSSDRVIDACVLQLSDHKWKMWYKDELNGSHSYTAYSNDLYNWNVGSAEITDCAHEGPNVFKFQNMYWMITDPWNGLGVYRSNDATNWTRCNNILNQPGKRKDDCGIAAHADVLTYKERAYIFYFTHPEVSQEQRNDPEFKWHYNCRRTSLQVAELVVEQQQLQCDRDHVDIDLL